MQKASKASPRSRFEQVDTPPLNTEKPSEVQISQWEAQLIDVGYIIIPNALPTPAVEHFRERIAGFEPSVGYGSNSLVRLFEKGMDFVDLLLNEPIYTLMEHIFGERMHIIGLQGHRMFTGNEVSRFHSDEIHWRSQGPVSLTCNAGDCIMYSNQMWHRGAPNRTDRTRLSVVPSYARRFVAQRFWPFLNYSLSRDILDQCNPRQRELLGEHPRGAYG